MSDEGDNDGVDIVPLGEGPEMLGDEFGGEGIGDEGADDHGAGSLLPVDAAFSRTGGSGKSVDELLGGPATLAELLDADDFVSSLASRHSELLAFFKQNQNAEKLIELVVSPGPVVALNADPSDVPADVQQQRRHAYVAYQALTSECMVEQLIEDYALLDTLFSFLDHPSQNDALKNGYFSKIVLTTYEKYPAELFLYFSIKSHMVSKFCANIKNLFVMELLFKFIDSLASHQWLADEQLIGQLVDLLDEERYDVETQESAVRTLEIICNICSYCPYSVLVTQILQTESVTAKLLHYTLSESPTKDFRVRQGLGIVIQVLNLLHKDADSFEFDEFGGVKSDGGGGEGGDGAGERADKEPPYFVTAFTARLEEFVAVLRTPSNRPPQKNAGVTIERPFGFTRLRVLEFVVGLIGTGFPVVVARLEELDVFTLCVDIFFDNPWNNFAHHQVYLLLSRVLATSQDFAIVERVLRRSNFIARTVAAFETFDSRTAGYFGHAVELCNEVLNCASLSASVQTLLEGEPLWATFVEQKLEPINAISSGPAAFGEDDEEEEDDEDFSYDPEQYFFGMAGQGGGGGGGGGGEGDEDDADGLQDDDVHRIADMMGSDLALNDEAMLDAEITKDLAMLDEGEGDGGGAGADASDGGGGGGGGGDGGEPRE